MLITSWLSLLCLHFPVETDAYRAQRFPARAGWNGGFPGPKYAPAFARREAVAGSRSARIRRLSRQSQRLG